jgi:hypothetical protein
MRMFGFNHEAMRNGWELRHLDETNVWFWLNQVPDFGDILNRTEFQNDEPAKRSDLIRIALIKHFGGVYVDYTTVLTQSFDWLLSISSVKAMENKFGVAPDMLLTYSSIDGEFSSHFDPLTNQSVLLHPTY